MIQLSGLPKSVVEAVDASILPPTQRKGIICVQVATKRGEINKPVLVVNDIDFRRKFGTPISGLRGGYTLQKFLQRGGKAYVSRVGHYSNVANTATKVGTKSTASVTVTAVAETKATALYLVTAPGAAGDTVELVVNNGVSVVSLGTYTVITADTNNLVATGLRTAINALTGTHGYVASGSGANVIVTAPTGTGASANSYVLGANTAGTVAGTITNFAGGVTLVPGTEAGVINYEGKDIGPGYDGIVITTAKNKADSSKIDLTVTFTNGDKNPFTLNSITRTPTQTEIDSFNNRLEDIKITSITTRIPVGTATTSGGVYNTSLLTDNDYIGDRTAKTGIYSFGDITDAVRIANFERNNPTVDAAYANYVDTYRKSWRCILAFPDDLTYQEIQDYRDGTGSYSHSPIDSHRVTYVYGDMNYYDPSDSNLDLYLSVIGDVLGLRAKVDSVAGEWISHAGEQYGKINNNKGLRRNLGAPDDADIADIVYEKGINPVIKHESFGTVYWGNRTCLRDTSKLLSRDNIAELMAYIIRELKKISDTILFKPNDPDSWKLLYRKAKVFIATLEDGRAIDKGENKNWYWLGDQDADTVSDVKFNITQDINIGKYRARFIFVPISATEYIGIEAVATDSGSLEFVIVENPLV